MAIKYNVTYYSFRKPKVISEYEYLDLKKKLQNDPNFSLIDPKDTITNQFSRLFKFLLGSVISFPICLILMFTDITKESGFLVIVLWITILWSLGGLFIFLMSATDLTTYAGYLKKKRAYFSKMENYIRKSRDYYDFLKKFYQ